MRAGIALIALFTLLSSGCATTYSGIGVDVAQPCCETSTDYKSFSVRSEELPAFLGPIVMSNFSVALAAHGLQPVSEGGDLDVLLRFERDDMSGTFAKDDFDERISPGGDTRFMARIAVEIREATSGSTIWRGSVQRIHNVDMGEVMHTGRASVALLAAFNDMLSDFPRNMPAYQEE